MPKPRGGGGSKASSSRSGGRKTTTAAGAATGGGSGGRNTVRPPAVADTHSQQQRAIPFAVQQRLLDVFGCALQPTLASPHLTAALQAVKRALFERDFAGAFLGGGAGEGGEGGDGEGRSSPPDPLDAYAARWSPTRALCYAAILSSPLLLESWRRAATSGSQHLRMVAIGGGAAETVAFGALFADGLLGDGVGLGEGHLVLVDSAPWASVVQKLCAAMRTMTTLEDDDTGSAGGLQRSPLPLIHPPDRISVDVRQLDILQVDDDEIGRLVAPSSSSSPSPSVSPSTSTPTPATKSLITLFFTLNELFTAGGIGAAATFLLRMTAATAAAPGTLLLVVDSPGSYAETTVGTQARRYPMRWLLDKILLEDAAQAGPAWTRLYQDDSIWFRLPPGLVYPIRLEDMRYQIHLYVRK